MSHHTTERVEIHINEGFVEKWYLSTGHFETELHWLQQLEDFERCPKLLSHSKMYIKSSYVGESLTKLTIPIDWHQQCNFLLDELKRFKCSHGDLCGNVTLFDGKLHLIDFANAFEIYSRENHFMTDEFQMFLWMIALKYDVPKSVARHFDKLYLVRKMM